MNREQFLLQAEEHDRKAREEFEQLKALGEDYLDEDGYPTDHALLLIEKWHWSDPKGWLKFIESLWHLRSWGWNECVGGIDEWTYDALEDTTIRYHISTAGWSGNESIVHAMMKNNMLWNDVWVQSRRGGHYIFEVVE